MATCARTDDEVQARIELIDTLQSNQYLATKGAAPSFSSTRTLLKKLLEETNDSSKIHALATEITGKLRGDKKQKGNTGLKHLREFLAETRQTLSSNIPVNTPVHQHSAVYTVIHSDSTDNADNADEGGERITGGGKNRNIPTINTHKKNKSISSYLWCNRAKIVGISIVTVFALSLFNDFNVSRIRITS